MCSSDLHDLQVERPAAADLDDQPGQVVGDPAGAGGDQELRGVASRHRPYLDDLTIDAADAVLGAGLATPAGIWLDDIPWFQWVRLHAKRLARAEGA